MEINNHIIQDDVYNILLELRKQLELNGMKRFAKFIDSGNNVMTCCPFHKEGQERKPSFGINKHTGECHCFGCGWSGDLSQMISNCFGKDDLGKFGEKWLLKNFVSIQVEQRPEIDLHMAREGKTITVPKLIIVTPEELDKYRYYHEYMWKRKLTPEIVELFDIGYDKETDCITFPVRDINGNTLFIARRSVKTKFFNYPTNVEKPIYGLYELKLEQFNYEHTNKYRSTVDSSIVSRLGSLSRTGPEEIIICESMLDALTCWVYGKYAVALNGLGTEKQFETLRNMACRKFILATDMDEAGKRARQNIKRALKGKLVTEYIWDINVAKDINDMTKDYFDSLVDRF